MSWVGAQWRSFGLRRSRALRGWPAWLASLATARGELAELNEATEQDFLQVGEKLQRFLEASSGISEQCAALVAVLSSQEIEQGAGRLRAILENARIMASQAESSRIALTRMLEGVGHVTQPLSDLNAKMRSFRVMAVLIRIEGSRLNQAGVDFETLAEDVRKLASDIEENGKAVLDGSFELRDIVQQAKSGITEFEIRQQAELPQIRRQAEASLAALWTRRERASATANEMVARYDSIRREIGDLVMSLQFHDITRQQVEHVAAALEQADQIAGGEVALLVQVCRLQSAQLHHAEEAFRAAVARVRQSLTGISGNVSDMAHEATGVLAGGHDGSFLAEMERGFAGIRTALEECAESRYSLSTVADAVTQGVREMSGFVNAIEEIGIRMQRIALNANIKAISIGEQGCALGAVADAIQRLAAESTGQTAVVAQGIRAVADTSERLSEELVESGEDLTGELERVIAAFHTADDENRQRLAEIGERGRSLSEELDTLQSAIHADQLLSAVAERSCGWLDGVVAAAEPLADDDVTAEAQVLIRNLERHYTMRAERAVHQEAAGEAGLHAVAPADLGENVELF